jgi:hypothetical protein
MSIQVINSLFYRLPSSLDEQPETNNLVVNFNDEDPSIEDLKKLSCLDLFKLIALRVKDLVVGFFKTIGAYAYSYIASTKQMIINYLWSQKKSEFKTLVLTGQEQSVNLSQRLSFNDKFLRAKGTVTFQEALLGKSEILVIDISGSLTDKMHFQPIHTRFFVDKKIIPKGLALNDGVKALFYFAMRQSLQQKLCSISKNPTSMVQNIPQLQLEDLLNLPPLDKTYFDGWQTFFNPEERFNYSHSIGSMGSSILMIPNRDTVEIGEPSSFEEIDIFESCKVPEGFQTNLLQYLNKTLLKGNLASSDVIEFKDGSLLKAENPSIKNQRNLLLACLYITFGSSLATKISLRYGLQKDLPLTFGLLKEVLTGIAARVTLDDLKKLFKSIQDRSQTMLCHSMLSLEDRRDLQEAFSFQDLTHKQMQKLLACFRELPQSYEVVSTVKALFGDHFVDKKALGLSINGKHDLEVLLANSQLLHLDNQELDFAVSEHFAKRLAYVSVDVGMIFPLINNAGQVLLYEVRAKLKDLNDGLVGQFLTPIRADLELHDRPLPILLNFRGTQTSSERTNACQSIVRDLDPFGIGRSSFDARKAEIIDELKKIIITKKDNYSSFQLHINGHSLGGVDVQRALALVVSEMAKEAKDPILNRIGSITAGAHNTPGVEADINERFLKDVAKVGIQVDLSYVLFESDPVQMGGSVYLGATSTSKNLNIKMITLSSDELKYLKVHSAHGFAGAKDRFERRILDESQGKDELDLRLRKWAYWNMSAGRVGYQTMNAILFVPNCLPWYALRMGHTIYRAFDS